MNKFKKPIAHKAKSVVKPEFVQTSDELDADTCANVGKFYLEGKAVTCGTVFQAIVMPSSRWICEFCISCKKLKQGRLVTPNGSVRSASPAA